jgi:glycosyltransferase involved in cell wall biosynthesis
LNVTMGNGPLVSVVTPVHNGEAYLVECAESVLAQTYKNWDYAIVDNASTDATPEIAAAFAARDSRIRHLRFEEFVTATANHNRAFDAISPESEFCKVVQADDWIYPECLALMVEAGIGASAAGIISSYQLRDRRVDLAGLPYDVTFAPGRDILRGTLLGRFNVTGSPTATLLRSAFVRERRPFWEEGLRHEDTEALLWLLAHHDFAFVHQILTFAREQTGSRYSRSENMNSHGAEDIVFLLRYGRLVLDGEPVLDDAEYRARLRARLKSYVWWHVRQFPRVSRLRDPVFFEFHSAKRRQILAEANGDLEVGAAMRVIRALLLRGKGRSAPRIEAESDPLG